MANGQSNSNGVYLDFERPIIDIEKKIAELEEYSARRGIDFSNEINQLKGSLEGAMTEIFANLTSWQRVQMARHPHRPLTSHYLNLLIHDFLPIQGDRIFHEDGAIVCGFGKLEERKVMVIGHRKGRNPQENIKCQYGSAHPEGYRKAMRAMRMAEKFKLPILTFIDTPGAYPGIGAEERGIALAIAESIKLMSSLRVPIICTVIGEGGSGGAIGIGVGDVLLMLQNAYYSVILPEGCSAILWKDGGSNQEASEALKLTAKDVERFGICDEIVPEPIGGAHRDHKQTVQTLKDAIVRRLVELEDKPLDELLEARYEKLRSIGEFSESSK